MLDYIFFHRQSQEQFTAHLQQQNLPYETREDDMGLVVAIAEDVPDATAEALDAYYDKLLEAAENQFSDAAELAENHVAGLIITLGNGRTTSAAVSPELLNRILEVISLDELNQLVEVIVSSVERPDTRPLCQR
jgi:hypothetical protein